MYELLFLQCLLANGSHSSIEICTVDHDRIVFVGLSILMLIIHDDGG